MPLFLIHATDRPDAIETRLANRPAHLDWAGKSADCIKMAGPFFADDGETFAGSVFVIEMETLDDVKSWAANDPYARAGLFERVDIRPFTWAIGTGPD